MTELVSVDAAGVTPGGHLHIGGDTLAISADVMVVVDTSASDGLDERATNGDLQFYVYERPPFSLGDVRACHTFVGEILWLREAGITLGCNADGTLFCPDDPVTRGQMAAFLFRGLSA